VRATVALVAILVLAIVDVTVPGSPVSQRITLRSEDGVSLVATWYEPSSRPAPAVILVHMIQRSRKDWDALASLLAFEGIGALAIDLRGHGESQGNAGENLSVMLEDVKAARRHLGSRFDVNQRRVGLVGASAGANLAAVEASIDSGTASFALLSPSLDY